MKYLSLYIDLLFCIILLPLMMIALPVERWWATAPVYFFSFVAWLYATYFLYKHYIAPRLFRKKGNLRFAFVAILISLALTGLFSTFTITSPYYHLHRQQNESIRVNVPKLGPRPNQQAVWLHFILVVTFSFAVGSVSEIYSERLGRQQQELERRKAELALYKAQVNPHFLFNTLNSLYGLLITGSDKTKEMMEKFINLTKYIYLSTQHDFVPLKEEVDYITQYIDLQRLRIGDNAKVTFIQSIEDELLLVPPMLLITFVENAFKYGISSMAPCYISIVLQSRDGNVCFEVENLKMNKREANSTHTGIENCRRRLELLYPQRYTLSCALGDDNVFSVNLTLKKEEGVC
ncbi:MAG: sensor histidine kinase [Sodaliphilus sp.]